VSALPQLYPDFITEVPHFSYPQFNISLLSEELNGFYNNRFKFFGDRAVIVSGTRFVSSRLRTAIGLLLTLLMPYILSAYNFVFVCVVFVKEQKI
jgi:hypothetical protein